MRNNSLKIFKELLFGGIVKEKIDLFLRGIVAMWMLITSLITIAALKNELPLGTLATLGEVLKFVGGPALGAGLAFYVNDYVHRQRKREEERGHLHGAAFAVAALYDDFLNIKLALRSGLAELHEQYSSLGLQQPVWAYAKPQIFTFNTDAMPQVTNLDFILADKEGRIAYQNIQYLARAYRNLEDMHERFNNAAILQQEKLSEALSSGSTRSAEQIIGKKNIAASTDFLMGLVERIEKDEVRYLSAATTLFAAADKHLGGMSGMHEISFNKKFKAENMPPLPPIIAKKLEQMQ